MRPLILVPTINSRHWNACYLPELLYGRQVPTGPLRRAWEAPGPTHVPKLEIGLFKERKKTDNSREGWEDGTPPPHRDFNVLVLVGL